MRASQHILIIGFVWPEPDSTAAGKRMMQLIYLFLAQGWKITFASAAADSDYMFDIKSIGVEKVSIELNNSSFDDFVLKLQPSIVVFDRFMIEEQFGWRVTENCPDALRVLNTEDLHCLRAARYLAFKENRPFTNTDLFSDTAKREVASILRCDLSLIISDAEINLLLDQFKVDAALLHHLPFMLDNIDEATIRSWPSFESRADFITIGNFLHEPNRDAVFYLKQEVWPLIRKKLPQAQLRIYGAYPSHKILELHQAKEGFNIMGRAANAEEAVKSARVCLAPLRFGAGIKGKLTEAMQCGTPSVTTDIGAEAMHGELPWSGVIVNTPEEIATAAIKLYTDKDAWQTAQQNGVNIINSFYSKTLLGKELINRVLAIQQQLEKHRIKNFTGAMLMHHTLASTKYMSRWIEAKNK